MPSLISPGRSVGRAERRADPWRLQMPLWSRAISACAICGGISQAQNASRSISLAAVLSLPQADREAIFT
jgi:hypothetical protein